MFGGGGGGGDRRSDSNRTASVYAICKSSFLFVAVILFTTAIGNPVVGITL